MIWINIKTTTLRESEYISASPTQQATWLKLLAYCSEHENGGIIAGAGEWNERAWLFGCGITLDEVRERCGLWLFDESGNLRVWNYPAEKELEVIAKREAGRRGGFTKAQNRSTASSSARAQPVAVPVAEFAFATSSASTEGVKGRSNAEGVMRKEEKETDRVVATAPPPVARKRRTHEPDASACAVVPVSTDPELVAAWDEWQQYRQARHRSAMNGKRIDWTEQAARLTARQVDEFARSHGARIVSDRIRSAIAGCWQGLNLDKLGDARQTRGGIMSDEEFQRQVDLHKPDPNSKYGF
jgi:hypothetical protein